MRMCQWAARILAWCGVRREGLCALLLIPCGLCLLLLFLGDRQAIDVLWVVLRSTTWLLGSALVGLLVLALAARRVRHADTEEPIDV